MTQSGHVRAVVDPAAWKRGFALGRSEAGAASSGGRRAGGVVVAGLVGRKADAFAALLDGTSKAGTADPALADLAKITSAAVLGAAALACVQGRAAPAAGSTPPPPLRRPVTHGRGAARPAPPRLARSWRRRERRCRNGRERYLQRDHGPRQVSAHLDQDLLRHRRRDGRRHRGRRRRPPRPAGRSVLRHQEAGRSGPAGPRQRHRRQGEGPARVRPCPDQRAQAADREAAHHPELAALGRDRGHIRGLLQPGPRTRASPPRR